MTTEGISWRITLPVRGGGRLPDSCAGGVVATGERFPDALAAVPAAASLVVPVLLVQTDRIPEPTAAQLRRLRPSRIVILGGPQAVTPEVERHVRDNFEVEPW